MEQVNDLDAWDVPVEDRVVSCTQLSELQCAVCLGLLSDPCQCINGHLFCLACILECIERKAECPQCRCELSENSLSKSLFVRKYIDCLPVHCRYHFVQPFKETEASSLGFTSLTNPFDDSDSQSSPSLSSLPNPFDSPFRSSLTSRQSSSPFCFVASRSSSEIKTVTSTGGQGQSLRSASLGAVVEMRERREDDDSALVVDPNGCPEALENSQLRTHELRCGFAFVLCQNQDPTSEAAEHYVRRSEVEAHLQTCHWRPIPCFFCAKLQPFHRRSDHEMTCEDRLIECKLCKCMLKAAALDGHLQDMCPESVVQCPFADDGCTKRMRRCQVEEHIAATSGMHMLLLRKRTVAQSQLIEEQAATIARLESECTKLKQSVMMLPTDGEMAYVAQWDVDRYAQRATQPFFQSPRFAFCGISWYMGVYPNDDRDTPHIGLFLFVAKSEQPTAAVDLAFELVIQNQNVTKTIRLKHNCRFPLQSGDGWGSDEAIEKALLTEQAGFLTQGCLSIQMHAKIRSIRVL